MVKKLMNGLVALGFLANAGCSAGHLRLDLPTVHHSRLIDLTHAFDADTIVCSDGT